MDIHPVLFEMDDQEGLLCCTRDLLHTMWQPGWEGPWGQNACMCVRVCVAESLHCSPETGSQNKKVLFSF